MTFSGLLQYLIFNRRNVSLLPPIHLVRGFKVLLGFKHIGACPVGHDEAVHEPDKLCTGLQDNKISLELFCALWLLFSIIDKNNISVFKTNYKWMYSIERKTQYFNS